MIFSRRRALAGVFASASGAVASLAGAVRPARAVIVLDSTWRAEGGRASHESAGFGAHIVLANQPSFVAVIALSDDGGQVWGTSSGTWIANAGGHGHILTSAHVFGRGGSADSNVYRMPNGAVRRGTKVTFHPLCSWNNAERTGYDLAVVQLDGPVTDAGPPPSLYAGHKELHARIVMVGYGNRGIGSVGEGAAYYRPSDKAAAENTVDNVMDAVRPPPRGADAGNWLGVTFRRESEGAARLDGILGSGDSGGSAWIRSDEGDWAIAGVNANSTGETYGSRSYFARVSGVRDWLGATVPGLRFIT
jgi:hypothetical protein